MPPLTDDQEVLFIFDDDFPKDQRKPEAEKVLAARRRGKSTRVVVPVGMRVHVRARSAGRLLLVDGRPTFVPSALVEVGRGKFPGGPLDLPPALPSTEPPPRPRRGRPRKRVRTLRDWENDDLLDKVTAIVGRDRRERADDADDDGSDRLADLRRLASQVLGQALTRTQIDDLRTLLFGGDGPSGTHKDAEKASVIRDYLLACQHGLGDRDLRRLKKVGRLVSR